MKGKRIHWVVPRYHTNMIPWVQALQEAGAEISMDVITRGYSEDHAVLTPTLWEEGQLSRLLSKLRHVEGVNKPYSFPNVWEYWRSLKKLKPHVVVVRDPSRYLAILAIICARLLGAKLVLYNQAPLNRSVSLSRRLSVSLINNIFNARWMTPVLGSPGKGTTVLGRHFFVPFAGKWMVRNRVACAKKLNLLSIGKFEKRKDQLLLLQALLLVNEECTNWHLTLVGEVSTVSHQNWYEEVSRFVLENRLQSQVSISINQKPSDMLAFYQSADVFILPSRQEPASISVVEAMANGLPVVCSNENGTACYIVPGENGYIFEAGNLEDLTKSLKRLFEQVVVRPEEFYRAVGIVNLGMISKDNFLFQFEKMLE